MAKRRKEQTGFDAWQPDLFGGAHKERGEGKSREEQMRFARQEMRDTGSRSLFELFDDGSKPKRRNPAGGSLAMLGVAALAGWWWLQRRPEASKVPPPAIPSGADPNTGQYGQQTGQGYPPSTPTRSNYVINPVITDASTRVCSAPVLQMQAQHPAPSTTREGAGQGGPTGAWVYRDVVLPACTAPVGNGRGGWGNGGH